MSAIDLVGGDAQVLSHHPAQEIGREEAAVAAEQEPCGTPGHVSSGHGSCVGMSDCAWPHFSASLASSGGRAW
jgi:hypothetical protein